MTLTEGQAVTYFRSARFKLNEIPATVLRDEGEWIILRVADCKNPIRVKRTSIRPCAT